MRATTLLLELLGLKQTRVLGGTPFKLTNHAIKRLGSARTAKLGVTTLRDVEALLNKGVIQEGANGVGTIVKDGFEAVVDFKTRVIITFSPH